MKNLFDCIREDKRIWRFFTENRDMLVKVVAAVMLVAAAFFIFLSQGEAKQEDVVIQTDEVEATEEAVSIYVDIGGEVNEPKVAELQEGSRVQDAIEAAGGVTEKADLTQINRAAFVEDGEKIFIPAISEMTGEGTVYDDVATGDAVPQGYSDGRININTADAEELQQLNGVGPATAEKIIAYREENGRFSDIEEIMEVSGIGEKTFEKFRDEIKVW